MNRSSLILLALAAFTSSCSASHRERAVAPEVHSEDKQLMQTSRQWSRAAASGNLDAIVSYWASDAVLLIPGMPTLHGKAAIRDYVAKSLKTPGFEIKWRPIEAQVSSSGDVGYLLERSTVTMPDAKGKLETQEFRVVTIWRKEADGKWRNVVDSSIPD